MLTPSAGSCRPLILLLAAAELLIATVLPARAQEAPAYEGRFEKVVLSEETTFPMELDIAADGRVFWIERDGSVKLWLPETGETVMAGFIPVTTKIEDGLLGLSLDPDFAQNQWLYLYYSPLDEGPNTLSRFTMKGNELDMGSEIVMLEVPVQRLRCCHSAGSIEFGPDGTMYLATGENAGGWNNSGRYIEGQYGWDAYWDNERTTANTADLRGKILRIRPQPDGTYTIPEGNLFEDDDPRTRPEIYTMGHRNPWRIHIDSETGWLYWGNVGPGNQAVPDRAPPGWEDMNQAKGPGFFGWPYFVGPNDAYRDEDPETEELLGWADPEHPINDSPNNTGIRELPPAQSAWIWYMYGASEEFPELGLGAMSAAVGPVYHYNPATVGPHGLPEYFDDRVFIWEFMRNWVKEVELGADGSPAAIRPFAPDLVNLSPIDLELGPDGRLYMLEWGSDFWGQARDGRLVRFDYYASEDEPRLAAPTPPPPASRPAITWPPDGAFFDYGKAFVYEVASNDPRVGVRPYLAHDTHVHPGLPLHGSDGLVQILPDLSHAPYTIAEYAELEAFVGTPNAVPPVSDAGRIHLNPKHLQAENNTFSEGTSLVVTANRQRPTFAQETDVFLEMRNGSFVAYEPVNFHGIDSLAVHMVADASGSAEIRLDGVDGPLMAEMAFEPAPQVAAPQTVGEDDDRSIAWTRVAAPVADPGGSHTLYVVFRGPDRGAVARLDRIDAIGRGITSQFD